MRMVSLAYDVAFELVLELRPVVESLMTHDLTLAEQLQLASTGALVNLSQAQRHEQHENKRAVASAHVEAREVLVHLDAARARGLLAKDVPIRETCERLVRLCWALE